jgi:HD-GYP domain-containing protein (c-di-GMP phosphodiesterase class II)
MSGEIKQRRRRITGDTGRFAAIVEASADAIVSVDADGVVETWNRGAEELFGRTADAAIGEPFELLSQCDPLGACETDWPSGPDATHRIAVSVTALGDGHAGAVVIARDVTEERRGAAALERAVADRTRRLQQAVEAREAAELETVERLSRAVEFRDEDTGRHVGRIGALAGELAERAGLRPRHRQLLRTASVLHDVGKVAIPDAVLLKPGRLTPEERTLVETHAQIGHRLLRGSRSPLLRMAADIALCHHERWDGAGYPRGLTAGEIPLEGRVVAIVDVYDALTRDRVYRSAFSEEEAREIMAAERGRHFDPELFDLFSAI